MVLPSLAATLPAWALVKDVISGIIVAIIALGTALFVGLQQTKVDMVETGRYFADQQNMFDLRLVSTVGWDRDHLREIEKLDGGYGGNIRMPSGTKLEPMTLFALFVDAQ